MQNKQNHWRDAAAPAAVHRLNEEACCRPWWWLKSQDRVQVGSGLATRCSHLHTRQVEPASPALGTTNFVHLHALHLSITQLKQIPVVCVTVQVVWTGSP